MLERPIAVLLLLIALVPAAFALASGYDLLRSRGDGDVLRLAGVVAGALITWWCAATARPLFTGRERPNGGLLSSSALVTGSVLCVAIALVGMTTGGFELNRLGGGIWFGGLGIAGLLLARS